MDKYEYDLDLDRDETVAAYKRFCQNGFKEQDYDKFIALAMKLYKNLPSESEKQSLLALARQAKEQYDENLAKNIDNSNGIKERRLPANIDLNQIFPVVYPKQIKETELSSVPLLENRNIYDDRVTVLCTPFKDDLDFMVNGYAYKQKKSLRYVDFEELFERFPNDVPELLHRLCGYCPQLKEEIVVYKNASIVLNDETAKEHFFFYLFQMRRDHSEVEQIIMSSDVFDSVPFEYKKYINERMGQKIGPLYSYLKTLNSVFIYPVSRETTMAILKSRFGFQTGDEIDELLEKDGLFLGYKRLNDILYKNIDVSGLKEELGLAKKDYKDNLDAFLNNSSYSVMDWNYRAKKKEEKKEKRGEIKLYEPEFKFTRDTYDSCMGNREILEHLEKIMARTDESLRVRCAWAICYALTGGDSLNVINVPEEYAEEIFLERWQMAYSAICILLCLDEGKIVFDIKEKSPWGLCCDGGARIRMNKIFLVPKDDYTLKSGVGVLLHEMFHAVQYRAINAKNNNEKNIFDYYIVNLNIYGYIDEWAENNTRYRSPENDAEGYRDQVVEASARAFSTECMYEFGNFSPPKLD